MREEWLGLLINTYAVSLMKVPTLCGRTNLDALEPLASGVVGPKCSGGLCRGTKTCGELADSMVMGKSAVLTLSWGREKAMRKRELGLGV